jgi:hypothetical protein
MKNPALNRAIALLLAGAVCAGGALAQAGKTVMKDTEPLPPEDRSSIGAVVMETEPVLAQKEQLRDSASRNPTSMMGAGPAVQPRKRTKSELDAERLRQAEEIMRGGAGTLQDK